MTFGLLFKYLQSYIVGLLDCWTVGLLDVWTVGRLDCWTVGPLDRWTCVINVVTTSHNDTLGKNVIIIYIIKNSYFM